MRSRKTLITGVNSGFGRHMTEQLLARGDRVAGTVRKMDAMNDLKAKYGELLWLAHLDMTDTTAIHQVVNKAFADLGKINVVVNNAGYGLFRAAEELTDEQILHQINTIFASIKTGFGAKRRGGHVYPKAPASLLLRPLEDRRTGGFWACRC
jgi:NAD(P)-dependent dehydrogenase (short-subunit alcohol dehydrogenase family)